MSALSSYMVPQTHQTQRLYIYTCTLKRIIFVNTLSSQTQKYGTEPAKATPHSHCSCSRNKPPNLTRWTRQATCPSPPFLSNLHCYLWWVTHESTKGHPWSPSWCHIFHLSSSCELWWPPRGWSNGGPDLSESDSIPPCSTRLVQGLSWVNSAGGLGGWFIWYRSHWCCKRIWCFAVLIFLYSRYDFVIGLLFTRVWWNVLLWF